MYSAPNIISGRGVVRELTQLKGHVLVVSMDIPWQVVSKGLGGWEPGTLHMVTDMELDTLEQIDANLPPCDVVVGMGGGSCCDTAKYLAWKRGCRMVLAPTIVSVDAPLTNMVAVREASKVRYIGDLFPEDILIDYDVIQQAPAELNRAGACDIASIHTALHDWKLSHDQTGELYDPYIAKEAEECLAELERNAEEVFAVSPAGIDTIIDLFRREVEFCARLGNSRPEEGAEHIVAYNIEHITKRHFVHGDIVGLGIFVISRLQDNEPMRAAELIRRCGLRYTCPDATPEEVRQTIETLASFKETAGLFYSVVDTTPVTAQFVSDTMAALYG
jgi:glycerol dehydrogenase-like iron-containing ADH family enzyme